MRKSGDAHCSKEGAPVPDKQLGDIKLHAILERVKPGGRSSCFRLWFCRNRGAACIKQQRTAKHCDECILGKPEETLSELAERITRGDVQ
jgi:hypothetical protein